MKKELPEKLFYKIGEVAEYTELEPYVLRYWEGEFSLKLTKSKNHQRLYQRKDVDQILKIKTLLYDEKFTIAGAKRKLREKKKGNEGQLLLQLSSGDGAERKLKAALTQVKEELESLLVKIENEATPLSR
jgi:DNA-binding transcriptional MerR regulator